MRGKPYYFLESAFNKLKKMVPIFMIFEKVVEVLYCVNLTQYYKGNNRDYLTNIILSNWPDTT